MMTDLFRKVLAEFEQITTFKPRLTSEYASALINLCKFLEYKPLRSKNERARYLVAHINRKFRLNRAPISVIYAKAAIYGTTFNYHEKEAIQQAFDLSDKSAFIRVLKETIADQTLNRILVDQFNPIKHTETVEAFIKEVSNPSKLRKEKGARRSIGIFCFQHYLLLYLVLQMKKFYIAILMTDILLKVTKHLSGFNSVRIDRNCIIENEPWKLSV